MIPGSVSSTVFQMELGVLILPISIIYERHNWLHVLISSKTPLPPTLSFAPHTHTSLSLSFHPTILCQKKSGSMLLLLLLLLDPLWFSE